MHKSSGVYVIDEDYVIVNFNSRARDIYPSLIKGEKCYRNLKGFDKPCAGCPLNELGQRLYYDPIRNIYQYLDVVEIPLENGKNGNGIIFSELDEKKESSLDERSQKILGAYNAMARSITDIFYVSRKTGELQVYRSEVSMPDTEKSFNYGMIIDYYVNNYVFVDDRITVGKLLSFDNVLKVLSTQDNFLYHYRVSINQEIRRYYFKCCRSIGADDFDGFYLCIFNEDSSFEAMEKKRKILLNIGNEILQKKLNDSLTDYSVKTLDNKDVLPYMENGLLITDGSLDNFVSEDFIEHNNSIMLLSNEDDEVSDSLKKSATIILSSFDIDTILSETGNIFDRSRNVSAYKDSVTGLYNTDTFYKQARAYINKYSGCSFSVVISDFENFRLINSVYGEDRGDDLLRCFGSVLRELNDDGVCARYAGDQFVYLSRKTPEEMVRICDELLLKFQEKSEIPDVVVKFGLYENIDTSASMSSICDKALMALNSIKHNYSRYLARYSGPVSQKQLKARTYERKFWKSLENGEFVVWYQPKYDSCSEKIAGAEALVRWFMDGKMISPGEFLEIFEEDGLISQLDTYVFEQVCRQQRTWLDRGSQIVPVSVNISRCSLFMDNVVEKYTAICRKYNIEPQMVPIEITESAAINSQNIKPIADKFAKAGFVLHMDDFGSGNSSLNGLNILHFDVVKLDKSLIDFIGDKNGELILTYTIALGKELGLHLVAEGVENYNQLQFLRNNGCDEIQGYYFSKPLPLGEFEKKIEGDYNCVSRKRSDADQRQEIIYSNIEHMPGGFFTYEKSGDERILSSNRYVWNLFDCENEDEFMSLTGGSFKGMVAPDEYQRVTESIHSQIERDSLKMDYVEYDIICKNGRRKRVVDFGRLNSFGRNDVFSVFIKEKN